MSFILGPLSSQLYCGETRNFPENTSGIMHASLPNHTHNMCVIRSKDDILCSMASVSQRTKYLHPLCQQSLVQNGAPEVLPPSRAW